MAKRTVYRPRADAEQRFRGIVTAAEAIVRLPLEVDRRIKKRLLNGCLWQITQSKGVGKYNLRYATKAAAELLKDGRTSQLQHEHVYTRKLLVERLLEAQEGQIEVILRDAIGSVVTKAENEVLCDVSSGMDG
jgi:hypothetical protein